MTTVRENVLTTFRERFGGEPALLARAPGRVNLIGEHTDYNDGFVLPAAIDRAIYVAARPRHDREVHFVSIDFGDQTVFTLDALDAPDLPVWSSYPRGALWWLGDQGFAVPGFDAVMGGDIPVGAGLSSSAAVEVAMIELGLALAGESLSKQAIALGGVEVEHQFIGVPCGVMDQMASAMGVNGHALLIDCRSLEATPIPVPGGVSIMIMDTAKQRGLVDSEYATRRAQCEEAARVLGVPALRDATREQVEAAREQLGDLLYRRARHIVTENLRTQATAMALRSGGLKTAGQAMRESHASLRDDYEVSCRELDIMSDLANAQPGCYGARMTGGGFGGCAVALVEDGAVEAFVQAVAPAYEAETGLTPQLYVCRAAAGSGVERL
ncbi:MAG: galactokinase [Chloroflexi bacterium]|nr:galactokinase [Chloroflexota bacterium]